MANYLFVCSMNVCRSVLAERYFRELLGRRNCPGEVRSAGVCSYAQKPLTQDRVDWSKVLFYMDNDIFSEIKKGFKINGQRLFNLDIEDVYEKETGRFIEDRLDSILDALVNTGFHKEVIRIQDKQEIRERWDLRRVLDSRRLEQYILD